MAKFTEKYQAALLVEAPKMTEKPDPLRLFFAPGTETYFQATAIAAQKGISPREVVEVAMRVFFLALNGVNNEPAN